MTKVMLLLCSLVFSSCENTSSKSPSKGFETVLSSLQNENNIPGLGAAILKDDELEVVVSGTKISGKDYPLNEDSPFHLGSCSKSMTATLAAILIEEGLLSWNSPLKELLPEVELHPNLESLTFEMLLAHRSGIVTDGPETFLNDWLFKALKSPLTTSTQARALYTSTILKLAPITVPGTKFRYANGNYMIAAYILESLTSDSWETLMKEKLFTPLGMNTCGQGPTWAHSRNLSQIVSVFTDNPLALAPAAGVHCSLKD